MDSETPWPKLGDSAFHTPRTDRGLSRADAWIDKRPPMHVVAWGFREAAGVIIQHIEENRGAVIDVLVFPYIFNWRHFLELSLKETLELANAYFRVPPPAKPPKPHHRVGDYWAELRPLLERMARSEGALGPDEVQDQPTLEAVDRVVQEFVKYDRDSFTFRYPTTTSGQPTLDAVPRNVNLRDFHNTMEAVAAFFDGSYDYMAENMKVRAEMEESMR